MKRRRILFIAEAVTLAHVARPTVLAQALNTEIYDVCFACDPRYNRLFPALPFEREVVYSIPSEDFASALSKGQALYKAATLRRYIEDDLKLINEWQPDLIVGDFRLSLAVSARVANIPYMAISNIYWSPFARQHHPIPEHITAQLVGINLAQALFNVARPLIFASHCIALNRVCKEYNQPWLGLNLKRVYTEADLTLYADAPGFIQTSQLPDSHHFIGPILWAPQQSTPAWWNTLADDLPVIYLTPGSSGADNLLPTTINALADLPVTVIAASAGKPGGGKLPANVFLEDYLPGTKAAQRADLVICNGGSPTTQQALAAGTPVLGICSNLDQYLNMQAIEKAGAGLLLRAGKLNAAAIRDAATLLLEKPSYKAAAQNISQTYTHFDAKSRFKNLVELLLQ